MTDPRVSAIGSYSVGAVSPHNRGTKSIGHGGVEAPHVRTGGTQEFRGTHEKSAFMARAEAIDARDIGLKGDRSGFDGQKFLNYLA